MGKVMDWFTAGFVLAALVAVVSLSVSLINFGDPNKPNSGSITQFATQQEIANFNSTFQVGNSLVNNIETATNKTQLVQPSEKTGIISLGLAFVSTAWEAIGILKNSFFFMTNSIGGLTGYLGIDPIFVKILGGIISIYFIVMILSIVFNKDL